MTTTALDTKVTVAYNGMVPWALAHLSGCKAASRRIGRYPSEVRKDLFTVADLFEMQANPDEGTFKVHACLKPVLAAAKKETP